MVEEDQVLVTTISCNIIKEMLTFFLESSYI